MIQEVSFKRTAIAVGLSFLLLPLGATAAPEEGTRFFVRDHLGNVVVVTDGAGNVLERNQFRPYGGSTTVGSGSGADDYARFTGKEKDSATGLYYFDARYYGAGLGRLLSPDPARQIPSPYAYAGSAPLVNVDPDGRVFTEIERMFLEAALENREVQIEPRPSPKRVPQVMDIVKERQRKMPRELGYEVSSPVLMSVLADVVNERSNLEKELSSIDDQLALVKRARAELEADLVGLRDLQDYYLNPHSPSSTETLPFWLSDRLRESYKSDLSDGETRIKRIKRDISLTEDRIALDHLHIIRYVRDEEAIYQKLLVLNNWTQWIRSALSRKR